MVEVVHIPASPELMTASRLAARRRCSRYHFLTYVQGYRPVAVSAPLRFGLLMHAALEAWWLERRLGDRGPDYDNAPLAVAFKAIREKTDDPYERVKAEELMRGYHFRWKDEPYDVLLVEAKFRAPIVHPYTGETREGWILAGKLDVIVRDRRDGRTLLMEHKSSSEDISPGSRYWLRLRLDGQLSVYEVGARTLYPIEGTIYDVIGKPDLKPHMKTSKPRYRKDGLLYRNQRDTDETPDEFRHRLVEEIVADYEKFYQRGEVHRLQQEIDDAILDVWAEVDLFEFEMRTGQHPRNPTACDKYGSLCHFYGVCTGSEQLENESVFYKSVVIHPELVSEENVPL